MKLRSLFLVLLACCSCSEDAPKKATASPVRKDTTTLLRKAPAGNYAAVDVSPMDIIYFPTDYPIRKMSGKADPLPMARVIYSRPHRQGRKIFGALLHYGEPWRLGANEATEIELFQPATVQNKRINKGRYILYSIPHADRWTIVFNSNTFSWGLRPDPAKDLYRFDVPVQPTGSPVEYYTMEFRNADTGAELLMAWDEVSARLPISF